MTSKTKGAMGREIAIKYFESLGYTPFFAKSGDPFDVVCDVGKVTYAIIVKYGKLINISSWKFNAITSEGFVPAVMMIDDNHKFLFLTNKIIEGI